MKGAKRKGLVLIRYCGVFFYSELKSQKEWSSLSALNASLTFRNELAVVNVIKELGWGETEGVKRINLHFSIWRMYVSRLFCPPAPRLPLWLPQHSSILWIFSSLCSSLTLRSNPTPIGGLVEKQKRGICSAAFSTNSAELLDVQSFSIDQNKYQLPRFPSQSIFGTKHITTLCTLQKGSTSFISFPWG